MAVAQSPEFQAAVVASKKLLRKPTDEELLKLYALYKQGLQDPKFEDAPRPGTFDFKGKYKYSEWQKIVDEGVTAEEAQSRYVQLIETLKAKYGYDESKEPEQVGGK